MEQLTFELAAGRTAVLRQFPGRTQRGGSGDAAAARARRGARDRCPGLGRPRIGPHAPVARGGRAAHRCGRSPPITPSPRPCRRSRQGPARWSPSTMSRTPIPRRRAGSSRCTTGCRQPEGSLLVGRRRPSRAPRPARRPADTAGLGPGLRAGPAGRRRQAAALAALCRGAWLSPCRRRDRLPAGARAARHDHAGRDAGGPRPPFAGDEAPDNGAVAARSGCSGSSCCRRRAAERDVSIGVRGRGTGLPKYVSPPCDTFLPRFSPSSLIVQVK